MKPTKIPWLSDKLSFYAIPRSYKLAKSKLFQEGKIYGMDCSSGAAVAALLLDEHDHVGTIEKNKAPVGDKMQTSFCVLDLCCAPGKLCVIICTQLRIYRVVVMYSTYHSSICLRVENMCNCILTFSK